jgi:hypothetical protein
MPRNASGTYSLPAGNPVVTGTSVSSTWANDTLNDLKAEMTDSLNRSGKGGMLAALTLYAGTVTAPGVAFSDDPDTGLYLPSAGSLKLAVGGVELVEWLDQTQKLSGTAPIFRFSETDAAANNKLWDLIATGEAFKFRALTDALVATDWLVVERTGGTVDSITLTATAITLNGYTPSTSGLAALASSNTFTHNTQIISGTAPEWRLNESDGAANNRLWRMVASGEQFSLDVGTDAASFASFMAVNRTGQTIDSIAFTATAATFSGTLGVTGAVTAASFSGPHNGTVGATTPASGAFTTISASGVVTLSSTLELGHASDTTLARIAAGRVSVEGLELGYRGLPSASVTTGAFTAADAGKCVNATGGVTVPNNTMAAGDVVVIDNQSGGAITITASITTLTLAGTTSTGNRTLAANGIATIKFRSSTSAVISGSGLS